MFIISQFVRVKCLSMAYRDCKALVRAEFSSKTSVGKRGTLVTWVWQHSVPCRILDWGPHFLAECWLGAAFSSLPCGPFLTAAYNMAACFLKANKGESPLPYSICQKQIASPVYTQEEGLTQGCEDQEAEITRASLEFTIYSTPFHLIISP